MQSINPTNNKLIHEYQEYSDEKIDSVIKSNFAAFYNWKDTDWDKKEELFSNLATSLANQKYELAQLMSLEMGKPLAEGVSEIEKCKWVCEYYIDNARKFLGPVTVDTDYKSSKVLFSPLGPILAIMPWNYPFWQVFRFAVPTLFAGNTAVLKHASNVSGCALAIEKLFIEAGFNSNIFRTILASKEKMEAIVKRAEIKAVTLTGSTGAGRSIAELAGKNLKKCVLELGGSDPYIVCADADIDQAINICTQSRLLNGGQSCISAKRFIVSEKIIDSFTDGLVKKFGGKIMGDPQEEGVDIGPMARVDLRDDLHEQVQESIRLGARCLLGGNIPDGEGAFYPPTILTNVCKGMPAYDQELFGPVASIIKFSTLDEAVEIANDSDFGLGAAIISSNIDQAQNIGIHKIESGSIFVNDFVKSDPRLPFGGIKDSGYGRELSEFGIKEFVNIKTICVK